MRLKRPATRGRVCLSQHVTQRYLIINTALRARTLLASLVFFWCTHDLISMLQEPRTLLVVADQAQCQDRGIRVSPNNRRASKVAKDTFDQTWGKLTRPSLPRPPQHECSRSLSPPHSFAPASGCCTESLDTAPRPRLGPAGAYIIDSRSLVHTKRARPPREAPLDNLRNTTTQALPRAAPN